METFNVGVRDFAPDIDHAPEDRLQNALARFGAAHIHERDDVLVDRELEDPTEVCRAAIVSGSPRLITAVAPVLVRNIDRINLGRLDMKLVEQGLGTRHGWLLENVKTALDRDDRPRDASLARAYKRAWILLRTFLGTIQSRATGTATDLLDAHIRSEKSVAAVTQTSSAISRRWGIVTSLQVEDFAKALREALGDD